MLKILGTTEIDYIALNGRMIEEFGRIMKEVAVLSPGNRNLDQDSKWAPREYKPGKLPTWQPAWRLSRREYIIEYMNSDYLSDTLKLKLANRITSVAKFTLYP
jgi:hypothetical protein